MRTIIHPARAMAFNDLIDGLEKARAAGFVSRKMCRATGLLIYCYTQRCVYDHGWDRYSLLARGLIVDYDAGAVVATPFPKFFNLGERGAVVPDLPFEAFEKLDGSLIIAFHHAGSGRWRTATKGAFDSSQAVWAQARLDAMDTSALVPGTTYLFEAIYPENVIVVRYPEAGLSLLAAYDASGREVPFAELMDLGEASHFAFKVVQRHAFISLAEMITTVVALPRDKEGFVIRFADGTRVKVKGDEYKRLHGVISRCTPLAVWDVMAAGGDLEEMRRDLPEEFWADFDQIAVVLQARYLKLISGVSLAAELAAGLSDKELGLRLSEVPDPIRPFLFPFRKATTDEAREKLRLAMLRTIRPNGNLLDGYVPSYAINNALDEAA
ncbi:2'-5' RNA ligase [Methylobacterium sp. WL30]|uniref:RNA ligase n=1 Tax=unclassified Methylobacterium TaxID=2615210 RepID=UPI0011C70E08|nr:MULTISPECIES: RNA ligase [unclassified Methylobacterium]TXN41715.1 2'-5' RNA ligase [Methylobacterium sp. WL93]TXN51047.1 2'-5' RNA ligase [Methylobacterium sp. WL119]TXN65825.1 2'-5' RNA ligase [Methylobacterium sp. WL30]TXN75108.1 2'-5' RNA ligase [Methylobacterium sp. WL18]